MHLNLSQIVQIPNCHIMSYSGAKTLLSYQCYCLKMSSFAETESYGTKLIKA